MTGRKYNTMLEGVRSGGIMNYFYAFMPIYPISTINLYNKKQHKLALK